MLVPLPAVINVNTVLSVGVPVVTRFNVTFSEATPLYAALPAKLIWSAVLVSPATSKLRVPLLSVRAVGGVVALWVMVKVPTVASFMLRMPPALSVTEPPAEAVAALPMVLLPRIENVGHWRC